jgi:hypothetical protein
MCCFHSSKITVSFDKKIGRQEFEEVIGNSPANKLGRICLSETSFSRNKKCKDQALDPLEQE